MVKVQRVEPTDLSAEPSSPLSPLSSAILMRRAATILYRASFGCTPYETRPNENNEMWITHMSAGKSKARDGIYCPEVATAQWDWPVAIIPRAMVISSSLCFLELHRCNYTKNKRTVDKQLSERRGRRINISCAIIQGKPHYQSERASVAPGHLLMTRFG